MWMVGGSQRATAGHMKFALPRKELRELGKHIDKGMLTKLCSGMFLVSQVLS